ncbi:MAG: (d)CMP kinase [Bdellovibrionales bacterium]
MKKESYVITVDGPAASGKTSVSRLLANRHNWDWISTGAFYRGLAYIAIREGLNLSDQNALAQLTLSNIWSVEMTPELTRVHYRSEDVTSEIYKEEVGNKASSISQYVELRKNLLGMQRSCAKPGRTLVAEGRDCGTVVFPRADLKIYLEARSDFRAERRAKESGRQVSEMLEAQGLRDHQDSTRKAAPMQKAEDAHVIDTSNNNLIEVVQILENLLRKELEI